MVEQQSLEIEAGRCLVYLLSGRDLSEALGSALAEGLDPAPVLAQACAWDGLAHGRVRAILCAF